MNDERDPGEGSTPAPAPQPGIDRDDRVHVFSGQALRVTWSRRRCIHAAACVFHAPGVFEPGRRPWIDLARGDADAIAHVVSLCPTGALHATDADGTSAEAAPEANLVLVTRNGPVYVRGTLEIRDEAGAVRLRDTRVALCRCGASANKPFCDGSHRDARFADPGALGDPSSVKREAVEGASLCVSARADGPLELLGPFVIASADRTAVLEGSKAKLCRCGRSANKPFCDGTHRTPA